MGKEQTKPSRDTKTEKRMKSRSKSPMQSLASEGALSNSNDSGSHVGDNADDEGNWVGLEDLPKRSANSTLHSSTSTVTMTSLGSSLGHSNNSRSLSSRSPLRAGVSPNSHKSPGRSPKSCLRKVSSDDNLTESQIDPRIAVLPFSSSEDDRRHEIIDRPFVGDRVKKSKDGPPKDGNGLYYQPSKASLHNKNIKVRTKKPQRIRVVRRKSLGETPDSSQHNNETIKSLRASSSKRSKSCEPQGTVGDGGETPQSGTKSKKKSSPKASRYGKKPNQSAIVGNNSSSSIHESWLGPQTSENKEYKDQETQKNTRKRHSSKTKSSQGKETKDGENEGRNRMISFLEDVATKPSTDTRASSPRKDRSSGLFKKSASARNVNRSRSPAPGDAEAHPDHRERRSSAPAKAFAAFNQYRKAMLPNEFDYSDIDDHPSPPPPSLQPPKEKVLLDVSELASLEIIRLGKDNSLKLDLFDLVKYLRQQQDSGSHQSR